MWIQRLRAKQLDEADAIFNGLGARYERHDLIRLLPQELRDAILDGYPVSQPDLIFHDLPRGIARLENLDRIADFLQLDQTQPGRWASIRFTLGRAYQLDGRSAKALALAREMLDRLSALPAGHERRMGISIFLGDYAWLMMAAGKAKEVLPEVERWMAPASDEMERAGLGLWKVRLHWALGDLHAAEAAADECIRLAQQRTAKGDPVAYIVHAPAHMMKGLIRARRGDQPGAQAAWRAGTVKAWAQKIGPALAQRRGFNVQNIRDDMAMSAWTGQDSDSELKEKLDVLIAALGSGTPVGLIARNVRIPPEVVRLMWLTRRGRELARQCAFYEIPYRDYVHRPVMLLGVAIVRATVLPGMTDEEEALVWKLFEDCQSLFLAGKLPLTRVAQLGLTWKGTTNFFGWGSAGPALPPGVRGPMAYVLGFRFEKLGRPKDARAFFDTARKVALPGSPLARLAQAQLDRLK
jgi:hypothetical protein